MDGYCDKKTDYLYNGFKCGDIIQQNGWKIPQNYPW